MDDEDKKDDQFKLKFNRKKHWSATVLVQAPDREEPLSFEVQSQTKVKRLKEMVAEQLGGDVKADRLRLTIDGGESLDKAQRALQEYDVKEGQVLLLEYLEKPMREPR